MAQPAVYDHVIYQGDTFNFTFRLRATNSDGTLGAYIDLTGCTAKSEIRTDTGTLILAFSAEVLDQAVTLGGVSLSLTHDDTTSLPVTPPLLLWDVQITAADGVTVTTYLRGSVAVTAEVTQS